MNVEFEKPPSIIRRAIKDGFKCHIAEPKSFSSSVQVPPRLSLLPLAQVGPHKQYTIHFNDLEKTNPLNFVIEVGWRFFEWTIDGDLGARILWVEGNQSVLVYFNIGRFVNGSIIGFQAAQALKSEAKYYFRILALPQIHIFAIWLHRADGDDSEPVDLLMPINPAPNNSSRPPPIAPLEALIPYTAERFFEMIKPLLNRQGEEPGLLES